MGSVPGKQSGGGGGGSYPRRAHHSGSWYSNDEEILAATLEEFLQQATLPASATTTTVRAVICPHAGYSYSGPTAAYSYKALRGELERRRQATAATTVVVLHPSHHVYLDGCAVSGATVLETPVGSLPVNDALRREILQLGGFSIMSQADDEHEHSGEMQYPYLAHIMAMSPNASSSSSTTTVLPIMCGALSNANEAKYGEKLAAILNRPEILTVVSTDFCHWGHRFGYQPVDKRKDNNKVPIHEFIRQMDHRGMDLICQDWQRPGVFADYLQETRNTICGRHAVAVFLQALATSYPDNNNNKTSNTTTTAAAAAAQPVISFVKYAQSSAAHSMRDSSVSYAAAVCTLG